MKPELQKAIKNARKIVENLRDMNNQQRLIQGDIEYQANELEKAIAQIEIHGSGTGKPQ
jgi:hypothetical protein